MYMHVHVHDFVHVHAMYAYAYYVPVSCDFWPLPQSWNDHVNVQKAILAGLWSMMDSGGHGSAKVIYPCFLPLLSQLVDKVMQGRLTTLYQLDNCSG